MNKSTVAQMNVGDAIPTFVSEPISRTTLALYAGASGDHNPIHIDIDFAKQAGMDDVFAHGMLVMAYLGRAITDWVPVSTLRNFKVRFKAISQIGDRIHCSGVVTELLDEEGEKRIRLQLSATDQHGQTKLSGEAVVALEQ